ncbi:hypothetical protein C7B82_10375 [Stenomitos frigidus ULC18]|uniref:Uncharacterized protein n=2 Tax=Stenomitos TaxID=1844270 RepID=A0A2T1EB81_9CYAN|nr:hypothetical protein C7B82_10375 [Stenomitos frigidus ULC18]
MQPMDRRFQQEVERLYRLTVYGRWCVVCVLWLTVGALSLWGLRYPISLLLDYFTWPAVRYGLAFNRLPAIGLATCVGFTVAVLLWQSHNELFGLSQGDRQRLEQQVQRIRLQGVSHPLWKFVCHHQSVS